MVGSLELNAKGAKKKELMKAIRPDLAAAMRAIQMLLEGVEYACLELDDQLHKPGEN